MKNMDLLLAFNACKSLLWCLWCFTEAKMVRYCFKDFLYVVYSSDLFILSSSFSMNVLTPTTFRMFALAMTELFVLSFMRIVFTCLLKQNCDIICAKIAVFCDFQSQKVSTPFHSMQLLKYLRSKFSVLGMFFPKNELQCYAVYSLLSHYQRNYGFLISIIGDSQTKSCTKSQPILQK